MIDAVVELVLGNALVSAALAVVAWLVHRHGRFPAVAHLLWVVVLIKAVTPPLLVVPNPFMAVPGIAEASGSWAGAAGVVGAIAPPEAAGASVAQLGAVALIVVWLAGSAVVLATSVRRIGSFGRLLRASSEDPPAGLDRLAASVARELGLRSVPPLVLTRAHISPMTWWSRGRAQLVLPAALLERADPAELRWVLAHELAHIKRRDHLVRWIEWLAAVMFWWNPVVWWARRNLRLAEEDACDALVLERVAGAPRSYAGTLLSVVEILAQPTGRVPAMATGIDAARSLEHRLSMIVSAKARRSAPGPLLVGLSMVVVTFMALGIGTPEGQAADPDPVAVSEAAMATDDGGTEASAGPTTERFATVSATLPVGMTLAENTYLGTAGPDSYAGTDAGETISGFDGADELAGGPGRDAIDGGDGDDSLHGGPGRDTIRGGAGADVIGGGAGRDEIYANGGDDVVRAWSDGTPDQIDCGAGNDRAVIDSTDTTKRCETVIIREPA